MSLSSDISELTEVLVSSVYPELVNSSITTSWGKTVSFAQIHWDETKECVSIRINNEVKTWHEAGILGLLSHELSHPVLKKGPQTELKTDNDSISRGLGPYLAVERLFAGKYQDHMIKRGKDKYLGYKSIREQLTNIEIQHLDSLLSKIGVIPSRQKEAHVTFHDAVIVGEKSMTTLTIEGHQFMLPFDTKDSDIKLVERNLITYLYVDEILVGEFPTE